MGPSAEADMPVASSVQLDLVGLLELGGVDIRSPEQQQDHLALLELVSGDFHFFLDQPGNASDGSFPAQHFFDGDFQGSRIARDFLALRGVGGQVRNTAAKGCSHGIEASKDEEVGNVEDLVLAELVPVEFDFEQVGHEIVAGRLSPQGDQLFEVGVDLLTRSRSNSIDLFGVQRVRCAQLGADDSVLEFDQARKVTDGQAEQMEEGLARKGNGVLLAEVAFAIGRECIEQFPGGIAVCDDLVYAQGGSTRSEIDARGPSNNYYVKVFSQALALQVRVAPRRDHFAGLKVEQRAELLDADNGGVDQVPRMRHRDVQHFLLVLVLGGGQEFAPIEDG